MSAPATTTTMDFFNRHCRRPPLIILPILLFLFLITFVRSSSPPFSCGPSDASTAGLPFCDRSLPADERAADLVARLTLDEKVAQLGDVAPAIPRLGVPAYRWWSEALHGVSDSGRGLIYPGGGPISAATSFPQVILTAASFDADLWYRIGQAIATEARAFYNAGQASGLTFWTPNINVFRDPRWGRGQETPGEDPVAAARYAAAYVRGLQGDSFPGGGERGRAAAPERLKVSACCKHFTAYDLDNWKGVARYTFDAKVTAQDLEDTFQPPFKSCVEEGRASGMMCSYNRVNGVPSCANYDFLSKTARGSWGFHGYIVSDCDAVSIIHDAQGYAPTPEDAVADAIKAGMDVNCGTYVQNHSLSAVASKKMSENDVNRALGNLFAVRMRLGLFDGNPRELRYGDIPASKVCSLEHKALALEAAREGIVLLKNAAGILPLSPAKVASLAVVGPNADNITTMLGNYAGPPCSGASSTPLQALWGYIRDVRYASGCDSVACRSLEGDAAIGVAESTDYVIMFMGLDLSQEKEELDRESLLLPGLQQSLIEGVSRAARRPVILVLLSGGPVDVSFARDDPRIGAILWAGYPGEAGGTAIANIIFGDHNPGGRLPVTWYPEEFVAKVPMTDMRMRADPATGYPGRTYRFYSGKPVFEFGHGLSYSTYSYEFASRADAVVVNLSTTARTSSSFRVAEIGDEACGRLRFSVAVRVANEGSAAGSHTVMLFSRWPKDVAGGASDGRPAKELIGFERVNLGAGEKGDVEFVVDPCEHLSRAHVDGSRVIDSGGRVLVAGDKELPIMVMA